MESKMIVLGATVEPQFKENVMNGPMWTEIELGIVYNKDDSTNEQNPFIETPLGSTMKMQIGKRFMREFPIGRRFLIKIEAID